MFIAQRAPVSTGDTVRTTLYLQPSHAHQKYVSVRKVFFQCFDTRRQFSLFNTDIVAFLLV